MNIVTRLSRFAMPGLLGSIFALGASATAASTINVPGDQPTIQDAVAAATDGDTINVAAGTYSCSCVVTVNKQLTLRGAKFGAPAASRFPVVPAVESILEYSGGLQITANNVIINGFVVQNSTAGAFTGYGIDLGQGTSGATVVNNILQNNIAGLGLANAPGGGQAVIQHNVFHDNNQPGGASGSGIYTDQYVAGATVQNVLIDSNQFTDNDDAGIDFSSTDSTKPAVQVTISNNTFDGNGRGMVAFNLTNSSVVDNTFQSATENTTADIRLFEGVNNLSILRNTLKDGAGRALRINNIGTGLPDATNVNFNFNTITGYSPTLYTAQVEVPGYNGVSNGTCNFWGSASGPSGFGPGPASASSVSGNVTFLPWWTAAGGPCTGGLVFCPSGTKVNVRWHYSANGSSGSWSGTKSTNCQDGSVAIGPQAMEGDLKVAPGTTVKVGYDFSLSGNKSSYTAQVSGAKVVFQARCVSGLPPSQSTMTVSLSDSTYSVTNQNWYPSGDQSSPLVYQGSIAVPDLCSGGQVRLDKGGTFTASVMF
jgi:hypothetical protein